MCVEDVEGRLVSRLGREEQADTPDVVVFNLDWLIKLSLNCKKCWLLWSYTSRFVLQEV